MVALARDGSIDWALGDPSQPIFPRSANKPLQAVAMLELGLDLDGELLALAAASHSGEPFHLDGVRRILSGVGLSPDALQTPPDYPYDIEVQRTWVRDGHGPECVAMNCSGKHAAMLATCVVNGWPTATYLATEHPLQQGIRRTIERLAAEPTPATGVDGCGAPLLALSLSGLARAVRSCVLAEPGTPGARVVDAMRAHPEWVGGTRRDVTALMRGVDGLVSKDGAEAVQVAGLPDGRAVALKIDDGGERARAVVMAAALVRMGLAAPVLEAQREAPLLGGGVPVGAVRALL